jgi:hypothetical protein
MELAACGWWLVLMRCEEIGIEDFWPGFLFILDGRIYRFISLVCFRVMH